METPPSGESLLSTMTWAIWGLVALGALFYFVSSYLFEILAQKLDEPRWMAWVPIASALLMLRLVGWEKWFWVILAGYVLAFGSMLLPDPLRMLSAIVIFPLVITTLVIGLVYFPRLATRRDLSMGVGLWIVLPQFLPPFFELALPGTGLWVSLFATFAALFAFLMIVFHDGAPLFGPHPIAYVLTLVGVAATGLAVSALPAALAENAQFQEGWQEVSERLEGTSADGIRVLAKESQQAASDIASTEFQPEEPGPVTIATTCPAGTREARETLDAGRAWWCEIEEAGVRHGPSRTWFDNGAVETEGAYDHGRRTGTWTRYWRSGGRRAQAAFESDVQHGLMHRWNANGSFETTVRYVDGEPSRL